ncbi:MAG TPA: hypothetical protein VF815_07365 [Myxococcaceae bacterium]|jgi:hypothetical protein
MKLAKMLMMMTAVTFLWGCGEGMQEPVQQPGTEVVSEGDVAQVQGELAAGDPFIGLWTAYGWRVRMYATGIGLYKNSPDPVCNPNDTTGWRYVTYKWTHDDGTREYWGQSNFGGCHPDYNFANAVYLVSADGRYMEERIYDQGLTNVFTKL